jgi:PAS domain S-box-containing protein
MEGLFEESKKVVMKYTNSKIIIECFTIFIVISFIILRVSSENFMLFHTAMEGLGAIMTFCIFIVAVNTYQINGNSFFVILGIGYGYAGVFYVLHALTLLNIGLYTSNVIDLSNYFELAGRTFGTTFTIIASIVLYRGNKKVNLKAYILSAIAVSIIIVWSANYQYMLQAIFVNGYSNINVVCVSVFDIATCISFILFRRMKNNIDCNLYYYVQWAFIARLVSEFLLIGSSNMYSIENVSSHIFNVLSYYLIYKGFVEKSIKEPYKLLYNKLDETNVSLEMAASELRESNERIEKDNAYIEQIEEILNSNEQCYKLIIENSRDAIFAYSDGKLIFYNESAKNMIGLRNKFDIPESHIADFIIEEEKGKFEKLLGCIYEERITVPFFQTKIKRADDRISDVEISGTFFLHRGQPAILILVRDITSNKQVEELKKDAAENTKLLNESREYNKLINEFFVNISHEVRTPLNVILGAIQVMEVYSCKGEDFFDKDKFSRYLKSIKQNCFRLLRLINNMIDLSKAGAGFLEPTMKNGDIISTVEDIVQSVAEYIKDKGVGLVFDTEIEEKHMAFDPDKMERIILNLLSNSTKFTRPGDKISVLIYDKGNNISISVKDTGIGIPEEKLKSVFERFVQVDKSLTRNHEGSGIGLSLVKSLVELQGGTIGVRSAIGEGTEFIISLPVRIIDDENTVAEGISSHTNVENICIEFSDIYIDN